MWRALDGKAWSSDDQGHGMHPSRLRAAKFAARLAVCLAMAGPVPGFGEMKPEELRLIPFPKQVSLASGKLPLRASMRLTVRDAPATCLAAADLQQELDAAGVRAAIETVPAGSEPAPWLLVLSRRAINPDRVRVALGAPPSQTEGYALVVTKDFAAVGSQQAAGAVGGIQTLRQLVRANLQGRALPCLAIRDWPALRYRGFQDDITRGLSPRLETMQLEVRLAALLRMNFWTYYMEHQFAFRKHPEIGPKDGSLLPEELAALVQYAKPRNVRVIGCQQSFGHFGAILQNPAYADLRETGDCLNPTKEGTYQLLDDLYSEQAPLLDAELLNVCCDETGGLGTGPSKPVAEKIGVGALYAGHLKRLHDILREKYGKRMMMWGDIILQHPENLKDIPKDTVMLSWGYGPAESFDAAITPFANSGYEFFVCPGVNCWGRILPNFRDATVNIRNYVRDGVKHGALGMLNTTWDDDGENLFGYNWHGVAWSAECAWSGSTTSIEDFNRRLGAVLFGEAGDDYGQAIALLARTHALPGYSGMPDSRFWQPDMGQLSVDREWADAQAKELLDVVEPAIRHLQQARQSARFNAEQIDYLSFGAARMKLMAMRWLDFSEVAREYERAWFAGAGTRDAAPVVRKFIDRLTKIRDEHARLRNEYRGLWLREEKPYALDWTIRRYDRMIAAYGEAMARLSKIPDGVATNAPLPAPRDVGLRVHEALARRTLPDRLVRMPLAADVPWADAAATQRMGIVVSAGDAARADQPMEIRLPASLRDGARLFELDHSTGRQTPVPCQIQTSADGDLLIFLMTGPLAKQGQRAFYLYVGSAAAPAQAESMVTCADAPKGMKWIENDKLRLLVGPEGGHIYRWEVKALGNRDLTQPGEANWAGFADLPGTTREPTNRIEVLARGPVLVRLRCTDDVTGMQKTISAYAGLPWIEVRLSSPAGSFWCYDDTAVMGAGTPTPGRYLFSDGDAGDVRPHDPPAASQIRKVAVHWSAKYLPSGPLLALLTPEAATRHVVGPGGGMGGVGIEYGDDLYHFVINGGVCPSAVKDTLDTLRTTLDYGRPPEVQMYRAEQAKRNLQ
jgi:hypothetical protein